VAGLYIHFPFCLRKCPYCSFVSFPRLEYLQRRYVEAVNKELRRAAETTEVRSIETVFLGGGTPTVLPVQLLSSVLDTCRDSFCLENTAEISIEVNPGTVTKKDLLRLHHSGVNRISFGVQSFIDSELLLLGRPYSSNSAKAVLVEAREAGFANISIDLMYGLPGQYHRAWEKSLEETFKVQPDHLSCYQLTIEDGTPFSRRMMDGDLSVVDEEEIEIMDELTIKWARATGLEQYEISNFARPGFECRHNINYWRNSNYLATGAAAVSCIDGRRRKRVSKPLQYCQMIESGSDPVIEEEVLDQEASFRESVVMGLRMVRGVCRQDLVARYGWDVQTYYGPVLRELQDQDLLELDETHLRLTERGRRLANRVMAELV
jgi:oxygen-independent coproporphyrinogen-3 oxidase